MPNTDEYIAGLSLPTLRRCLTGAYGPLTKSERTAMLHELRSRGLGI